MALDQKLDQKLVVRFQDGRTLKGTSQDFSPNRESFHLNLTSRSSTNQPIKISIGDLKGVFFVKDFVGKKAYQEDKGISYPGKTFYGERTIVRFKDGEVLYGFTQDYAPGRLGFFLFPYDSQSNNLKLFAIHSFVSKIEFPPP
jgi:small nuclear ribonucleoprotein (snRNP)-like protein